jgi:hypothetical protein
VRVDELKESFAILRAAAKGGSGRDNNNMVIDKRIHRNLGLRGVYADVFEVDGRAYKLFLSGPESLPRQTKAGRKRVFESQCEAFRSLSKDPWLQSHAATFFGNCTIDDVIGEDGTSVEDDYLLDCCYSLELLDLGEVIQETGLYRNEAKAWSVGCDDHWHMKEAKARFKALGISTMDASVVFPNDPEKFKFIDFEIENYY